MENIFLIEPIPKEEKDTSFQLQTIFDINHKLDKVSTELEEYRIVQKANKAGWTEESLKLVGTITSLLQNNKIYLPDSLIGIDTKKLSMYVEEELKDKIVLTIRKILHFLFGGVKQTVGYIADEVDKNTRINNELKDLLKKLDAGYHKIDRMELSKIVIATWTYENMQNKIHAMNNIYRQIEIIGTKSSEITKEDFNISEQFNSALEELNYSYDTDTNRIKLNNTNEISEKDTFHDLGWDVDKVKNSLKAVIHLYENRRIFEILIKKLKTITTNASKIDDTLNEADNETTKNKVVHLKDEYYFISSLKDIIFQYLHRLALQHLILVKNTLKKQ